ncbi:hypothetical protein E2C01_080688 [Portunus trituberculatus]|uniref:Uncharacterized protein n=1 Tax=Portunus trituberculatus TaxID=210409 RepID=A0A5B7IUP8_PORTR|nr:hypothetical protein [Portunus trituberculatus]
MWNESDEGNVETSNHFYSPLPSILFSSSVFPSRSHVTHLSMLVTMVGLSVSVIETPADFDLVESLMRVEVTSIHSAASAPPESQRYDAELTHLRGLKDSKR